MSNIIRIKGYYTKIGTLTGDTTGELDTKEFNLDGFLHDADNGIVTNSYTTTLTASEWMQDTGSSSGISQYHSKYGLKLPIDENAKYECGKVFEQWWAPERYIEDSGNFPTYGILRINNNGNLTTGDYGPWQKYAVADTDSSLGSLKVLHNVVPYKYPYYSLRSSSANTQTIKSITSYTTLEYKYIMVVYDYVYCKTSDTSATLTLTGVAGYSSSMNHGYEYPAYISSMAYYDWSYKSFTITDIDPSIGIVPIIYTYTSKYTGYDNAVDRGLDNYLTKIIEKHYSLE